jgi:hypothetical protein
MALKIKPFPVAVTTENGITTNEPKGSNVNLSMNNYTKDFGFRQYENLFIFADFPCQPNVLEQASSVGTNGGQK